MPSTGTGAPILIVDDDATVRELVVTHLRREGFDVREAASGEAALGLIEIETPGLVVLDMSMPGMSGTDVVRALRERPETATLPIMVLTGKGDEYPLATSLGVGADDYLTKPIRLDEFAARVRAHLRSEQVAAEQALRATDEQYRAIVEQSADGILVSNGTGRYIEANPAICRMLGYSRDELLAMYTPSLAAADDPMGAEEMDERLTKISVGTSLLLERRYRRKDGTSLPAEASFTRLPDGRLQRNIRDISGRLVAEAERVAGEEALRQSERSLAEAQRIAHVGSWERDVATGLSRWSDELHRIFGLEPDTFTGPEDEFLAFVHPNDRAAASPSQATREAPDHAQVDYRIIRSDGTVRVLHDEVVVERDAAGKPIRYVGTTQDITERVAAEAERGRLALAVEQTADAISMHDLDGTVTYVNPAFAGVYGYESAEIVGRHGVMIDSGRHEPSFFSAIRASAASGRTWTGTVVNRRKDGALIELEAVISAIHDAHGRVTGYVQADRDVTRERALERDLERNARERETIEAALAQIDPAASAEEVAAAACAVINALPGVDSTMVAALGEVEGAVLAAAGQLALAFAPGRILPASRVGYLRERGSGGPWFDEWRPRSEDGAWAEAVTATGLRTMAYAPLRSPHGVVGIVGIGSHDPATAQPLIEHLPALATFASLLGALLVPKLEDRRREAKGHAAIQAVLDASAFAPHFQPIVDLGTGAVMGYEALTRFADGQRPDLAFAAAARVGLGIELEVATISAAIEAATHVLPLTAYLSLNMSPEIVHSGHLGRLLKGLQYPIGLEITEHVAIDDYAELRRELSALGPTVSVAVDDAGAGHASFRHILELAPDVVKLDVSLIRGIDADPARQALVAGMSYFAVKRKIQLVAEGVETNKEFRMLRSLGVHYGQGYLLGRPQDGRGPGPWPTQVALGELRDIS